jgi:hypothetical protein
MLSRFTRQKVPSPHLLKLPSFCTPTEELSSLIAKRDAQLTWMREKGMKYLGDPLKELSKRPQKPQPGPAKRLTPPGPPEEPTATTAETSTPKSEINCAA